MLSKTSTVVLAAIAGISLSSASNAPASDTSSKTAIDAVASKDAFLRSALDSVERSENQLREKFGKELATLNEARLKALQQAFDRASSRRDTESVASLAAIMNTMKGEASMKDDRIAEIAIAKGVDAVRPLRDGEKAYSNRDYTWVGIPEDLPVSRFGLTPGGGSETIKGKISSPGWVHLAIGDETNQKLRDAGWENLADAGWEKTDTIFAYTARGKTTMFVFKKYMEPGSFQIDRFHWSGPIILLP
jgi:hypothetical protein